MTTEVAKTVREYKAGKIEFRNDPTGIVHAVVGKISFEPQKLVDNIQAFVGHILSIQPTGAKGQYVKSVSVSATMTPGIMVAV